jgi:hypothetical protein
MSAAVKFAGRAIPLNVGGLPAGSYRLWVEGELVEWDGVTGEVRTVVVAQKAERPQLKEVR